MGGISLVRVFLGVFLLKKTKLELDFTFIMGVPCLGRHQNQDMQPHASTLGKYTVETNQNLNTSQTGPMVNLSKILRCEGFRQSLIFGLIKACLTPVHGPYLLGSLNFGISSKKNQLHPNNVGSGNWIKKVMPPTSG